MKRTITLILLALAGLSVLIPAPAADLSLTYRQLDSSNVLALRLKSSGLSCALNVRQLSDGSFTLECAPFFCYCGDRFQAGELKPKGLLSLMLKPMSSAVPLYLDRPSCFTRSTSPSMKPSLSGLSYLSEHVQLFALTPLLNQNSPLGLGAVALHSGAFAGFLCATSNSKAKAEDIGYQVSWSSQDMGRNLLFTIIGANADASIGDVSISGTAFLQTGWDLYLGGGSTTGWTVELTGDSFCVEASRRLGSGSVKLSGVTEDPIEKTVLKGTADDLENGISCYVEYSCSTYEKPVYGGTSQMCSVAYAVGACYALPLLDLELEASSSTSYDKDRGKVEKTCYSMKGCFNGLESGLLEGSSVAVNADLNRNVGDETYFNGLTVSLRAPDASVKFSSGRISATLGWSCTIEDAAVNLSIDQDRHVSATLKLRK